MDAVPSSPSASPLLPAIAPQGTPLPAACDVAIVGAGVAGLTCARHLLARGVTSIALLDAADDVGGRVRTDSVDGPGGTHRLDRGFQVYLPAYPEARGLLDHARLDLRPFVTGALCRTARTWARLADPRAAGGSAAGLRTAWQLARCPVLTWADALRVLRHLWPLLGGPPATSVPGATRDWLRRCGFSDRMVRHFWRPFLAGVLLDPALSVPADFTRFTLAMFACGGAAVPALGMGEIPRQLAAGLPDRCVFLHTRVVDVEPGRLLTADGGYVNARCIVVATDADTTRRLLPGHDWPDMPRCTSCLYFAADHDPVGQPILLLDGDSAGPVNHAAVMTAVSPALAPPGKTLISVSTFELPRDGWPALARRVTAQLEGWFGPHVRRWTLLRGYAIPQALPACPAAPVSPVIAPGLVVAGDHTTAPSLNGAMASGRRAAEAVYAQLSQAAA
ncbi:MAG: protoporphyrinogen/coproporphyrinogen oxidase [Tepidisphaerales bacterium]